MMRCSASWLVMAKWAGVYMGVEKWGCGGVVRILPLNWSELKIQFLYFLVNQLSLHPAQTRPDIYQRIKTQISDGVLRPGGQLPSSRALASDLGVSRATVVTAYEQLAIDLCARVLLDPGDTVVIEEPCYLMARRAFEAAGAVVRATPIVMRRLWPACRSLAGGHSQGGRGSACGASEGASAGRLACQPPVFGGDHLAQASLCGSGAGLCRPGIGRN